MTAKKNKFGFTIAEMLVALAVMAILLTAVAVAFNASAINYGENKDMFDTINMGRQAMMRMTSQLRTAVAVKLEADEIVNPKDRGCTFLTADGKEFRFCYHADTKTVYLHPLDASGHKTADHVLCQNVTAMTFNRTVVSGVVKSVQIPMTVTVGNSSQTIASAVVLRKTLN
jgi:prepilin-type N-terminal cleavage/methylation domain-containing protein